MPAFFFHISIELLVEPESPLESTSSADSVWLEGVRALLPFLSHTQRAEVPATRSAYSFRDRALPLQSAPSSRRDLITSQATATPAPHAPRPGNPSTALSSWHDNRVDAISIESTDTSKTAVRTDMKSSGKYQDSEVDTSAHQMPTKARYEPLNRHTTDTAWGIVHLYRDAEDTPGLAGDSFLSLSSNPWYSRATGDNLRSSQPPAQDADCTMLSILAVPSYLAPSDFLGFVGEKTREQVSHFRMIRTARANRYMVLMKFRDGKVARRWQQEWNGKVFNSMEPETCHVVFVRSVEITLHRQSSEDRLSTVEEGSFAAEPTHKPSTLSLSKPPAPRTPSLIELPTCPVCLERMDETSGLLSILCQHVFHCTCLQKWSGGGCPVCRFTHDDFSSRPRLSRKKSVAGKKESWHAANEKDIQDVECQNCHIEANLWQCLVCGHIGCGRYEAKHAHAHFEQSGHSFAMDMDSKRVWDYSGDGYVHRIIQSSPNDYGGKVAQSDNTTAMTTDAALTLAGDLGEGADDEIERAKMEGLSLEYTHLLTSQLESQRVYFEEQVERAVDKAATATAKANSATLAAQNAGEALRLVQEKHESLVTNTIPSLQQDKERLERRSGRLEETARKLQHEYADERAMNARLMERIDFLGKEVETLKATRADLEEQNRDLSFFISGQEKLRQIERREEEEEEAGEEQRRESRVVKEQEEKLEHAGGNHENEKDKAAGKELNGKVEKVEKEAGTTRDESGRLNHDTDHGAATPQSSAGKDKGKDIAVSRAELREATIVVPSNEIDNARRGSGSGGGGGGGGGGRGNRNRRSGRRKK